MFHEKNPFLYLKENTSPPLGGDELLPQHRGLLHPRHHLAGAPAPAVTPAMPTKQRGAKGDHCALNSGASNRQTFIGAHLVIHDAI